jgi:hypothetical protein
MKIVNKFFKSGFGTTSIILYAMILLYPFLVTGFRVFTEGDLRLLILISIIAIFFTFYGFFKISEKNQNSLTTKQVIGLICLLLVFTTIWIILAHIILMFTNSL